MKEANMMKKVVITGERQVSLADARVPEPKDDWVLVKVCATALCTEYKDYLAGRKLETMGHEGAGEVAAVAQPGPVNVGDRVVILPQLCCGKCDLCTAGDYIYCQNEYNYKDFVGHLDGSGTFSSYVLKPARLLPAIPAGMSYAHATMAIDGIGASFGAFQAIDVDATDTVLITGLGPVGLGAVANARVRNARVIGVEPTPWRKARAMEMGAATVFDPNEPDLVKKILAMTDGRGATCAVDCSGKVQSERLCIDATRRRGRVAFVGESGEPLPVRVSPDFIRKGLTVVGSWLFNRGDYSKVMQVIQQSPLISLLISHELPMSRIQDGFELLAGGQSAKIVVDPQR